MTLVQKIAESDRLVGARIAYLLEYLHPAVQMRVSDEDQTAEFFSLLDEGIESLADYNFDVEVKQVLASPSERQARIRRVENILGYDPSLIEIVLPFLLKNSDIDYSERIAIIKGVEDRVKNRNQAAAEQLKMARQKLEGDLAAQKAGMMIKADALEFEKQNVPKVTLAGKLPTDPLTVADLLNWAAEYIPGMAAHPAMLMAGRAAEDLQTQGKLNLQQTEEDRLTPEYKKRAIEQNVAVKEEHQSAKDAANRALREVRSGNAT